MTATTQPTAAEWKDIEERLQRFLNPVHLQVDGFEVTLVLRRISQFRNAIMVFIDGSFKGRWIVRDTEEARRFLPLRRVGLYSSADRRRLVKVLGKKEATKCGVFKTRQYRDHCWTSFRSLKRHLVNNNDSIVLVTEAVESEK